MPVPPDAMQLSPEQQAVPPAVHALPCATQETGAVQTPFVQVSVALQHGVVAEQLWLVFAQALAAWHVPLVVPGWIAQERPAQQSPLTVQVPLACWQDEPPEPPVQSAHTPFVQVPLQQSVPAVHCPPVSLQVFEDVGSRQA